MSVSFLGIITILISFSFITESRAILNGEGREDITSHPPFQCRWHGGVKNGVTCDCRNDAGPMVITEKSIPPHDAGTIEIRNCKDVTFAFQSVYHIRPLRHIHLQNIASLKFAEESLIWYGYLPKEQHEEPVDMEIPSVKIVIENCNITQIASKTFQGRINIIYFDNVIIDNLEPFAFNSLLQLEKIIFKNTILLNPKFQALKKFNLKHLEFNGVKSELIPSRFISNVTVYETFTIRNCNFTTLRPGAFVVYNPANFQVINTRIDQLDGEAFNIITRGDVLFKDNNFDNINDGAFHAITVNNEEISSTPTITYASNTFTKLTRNSLNVNDDFIVKFTDLKINETCNCKNIDHNIRDTIFYSEIKCLFEDDYVTIKEFKANGCSIMQSYSTIIIIVGVVCTLLIIIVTVLVIYYKRVYLSRKYGNDKNSKKGNMSMIVPDGRTYRETELHVIVERADLLTTDL